jgi:uncharacterized phage protein (TIGR01671 family)
MREIKFRAWDKRLSRWIYTGYHVIGEVTCFRAMDIYLIETMHLTPECLSTLDRWNDIVEMQFTGLKDKNGKEIYEGDIVRPFADELSTAEIKYFVPGFQIATKRKDRKDDKYLFWNYFEDEIEIIGNIYENPELLK